jgi:hypothetical protein
MEQETMWVDRMAAEVVEILPLVVVRTQLHNNRESAVQDSVVAYQVLFLYMALEALEA